MTIVLQILFWGCVAGLAYIYVGYPAMIWLLARRQPAMGRKPLPPVSAY